MHSYLKATPERRAKYNASLKAYQADNQPSQVPTSVMLSHGEETISKERFAAIFSAAWKEKLEEIKGKR